MKIKLKTVLQIAGLAAIAILGVTTCNQSQKVSSLNEELADVTTTLTSQLDSCNLQVDSLHASNLQLDMLNKDLADQTVEIQKSCEDLKVERNYCAIQLRKANKRVKDLQSGIEQPIPGAITIDSTTMIPFAVTDTLYLTDPSLIAKNMQLEQDIKFLKLPKIAQGSISSETAIYSKIDLGNLDHTVSTRTDVSVKVTSMKERQGFLKRKKRVYYLHTPFEVERVDEKDNEFVLTQIAEKNFIIENEE